MGNLIVMPEKKWDGMDAALDNAIDKVSRGVMDKGQAHSLASLCGKRLSSARLRFDLIKLQMRLSGK